MRRVWTLSALALLIVAGIAWAWKGPVSMACVFLGAAVSAINLYGLHRISRFIGSAMAEKKEPPKELFLTFGVVLLKLPVLAFGFLLVRDLGPSASGGFLCGFGVVYFALMGWAQALSSAHSSR